MIIVDNGYSFNGGIYRRTISDAGLMIRKIGTGEVYPEAVDALAATWEYEETDEPVATVEGAQDVVTALRMDMDETTVDHEFRLCCLEMGV